MTAFFIGIASPIDLGPNVGGLVGDTVEFVDVVGTRLWMSELGAWVVSDEVGEARENTAVRSVVAAVVNAFVVVIISVEVLKLVEEVVEDSTGAGVSTIACMK